MERRIKQIVSSLILEYASKLLFTITIFWSIYKLYHEFLDDIFDIKFKSESEFILGVFILSFVFYSYKFYTKVDNTIIKDLENIIYSIRYNSFKSRINSYEFNEIKKALIIKNNEIDEKNRFINGALSYISHDMKTPITVINANVKLLRESELMNNKNIERLRRIEQESNRISDYITNLMDVTSSFSENSKRDKIRLFDLITNIKKNLEIYSDLREEPIKFENVTENYDAYIIADINKFQKSLLHLLNNAYEHRKEEIKVVVNEEKHFIKIDVIDDGLGFNDESIKKAKEIFYTDNYGRTCGKGYGIGLYFVNSYMESLGGTLELKNNGDVGARQTMKIPIGGDLDAK